MVRSLTAIIALCCTALQAASAQLVEVKQLGSSPFYIGETSLSWNDAAAACGLRQLRLAQLESWQEQQELSRELIRKGVPNMFVYWVGATEMPTFKWINSQIPLANFSWSPEQPDRKMNTEHCIALHNNMRTFEWRILDCTAKRYFLCEAVANPSK